MTWINRFFIVLWTIVLALLINAVLDARYLKYKQTDPLDIVTRNKIDRDIDAWIKRLDRQTWVDTVTLRSLGGTVSIDTIQLDRKYSDLDYKIFMEVRDKLGNTTSPYQCVPLTDSSFTIEKNAYDSSLIQWMTVYK